MAPLPVFLSAASSLYTAIVRGRRAWYSRAPDRQRSLQRPVISVGSLSVGGSGKTPVVATIARSLLAAGERPAILSRGYRRRVHDSDVTVVSDGTRVLADLDHAGDEPLMLARELPGARVVVASERYLAGRVAEARLGATVHLLDDGFQHIRLGRDVNLLVVSDADLDDRVLPAGRLREPLSAAADADAVLVAAHDERTLDRVRVQLHPRQQFVVERKLLPTYLISSGTVIDPAVVGPVFVVAGIARPERLFAELASVGWRIAGTMSFRDHHRYRQSDIDRIVAGAREAQTHIVVTTAKDAVRLEPLDCTALAFAVAPLDCRIAPAEAFDGWLRDRLAQARHRRSLERPASPESADQ